MDEQKPESPVNKWWPSILSNLPLIIITSDKNGVISYINHVLPEFTPEKVIGTPVFNYIPSGYEETYRNNLRDLFEHEKTFDFVVTGVGPQGTTAWYHTLMVPIKNGNVVEAALIMSSDITEKMLADDEITKLKKQLESKG